MDKTTSSQAGKQILVGDWETKLTDLIKQFREDELITNISARLPLGYSLEERKFGKIKQEKLKNYRNLRGSIRPMSFFIEKTRFDSLNAGLRQSFKMPIVGGHKPLKSEFHYKWDYRKEDVVITRYLGSLEIPTIEENIDKLVKECSLFKHLYEDKDKVKEREEEKNSINSIF